MTCKTLIFSLSVGILLQFLALVGHAQEPPSGCSIPNKKFSTHGTEEHHEEVEPFLEFPWDSAEHEGTTYVKAGPATLAVQHRFFGETVINGNTLVHVVPRFPGTLKNVFKTIGSSVRAGDLLATVESNQSLTAYAIKAEIDGVIIDQDATKGEFVASDKVLFKLANLDTTWANFVIPPRVLSLMLLGTPATVISQSTDARLESQITYVMPTLSDDTRMGHARLELPNKHKEWPPGMFVTVEVKIGEREVRIAVPESSVLLIENKPTVFVQAKSSDGNEGFLVRHITTGQSNDEWTEVTSGLDGGETVAFGNTFILKAELGKSTAEHSH